MWLKGRVLSREKLSHNKKIRSLFLASHLLNATKKRRKISVPPLVLSWHQRKRGLAPLYSLFLLPLAWRCSRIPPATSFSSDHLRREEKLGEKAIRKLALWCFQSLLIETCPVWIPIKAEHVCRFDKPCINLQIIISRWRTIHAKVQDQIFHLL